MMTRLVIFDLDGTLLDSLTDLAISTNHALRQNGFPEHEREAYRHFVGNGVRKLIERALPEGSREAGMVERVMADFMAYYSLHKADYTAPYDGIPALLQALRKQGMRLAVASNKFQSATEAMVPYYFGEGCFDFIHGQRESVPPKPDPQVVMNIMAEANVEPGEVLYVGDSGVDMQTAARAGVRSVGVLWGFRSREELLANGAMHVVERPADILALCEK